MERVLVSPYDDPNFGALDRFTDEYEWYAAGGTDEPPSLDDVPVEQRAGALEYTKFQDWKYANGLWESVNRHIGDPEYFRSQFKLIQGGDSAGEVS